MHKDKNKSDKKMQKVLFSEQLAASQQLTTTESKTPSVVVDIAATLPRVNQLAKTLRKNIAAMQNEITRQNIILREETERIKKGTEALFNIINNSVKMMYNEKN